MDDTQDKPAQGKPTMVQPVQLVWPRPSDGGSWKLLWFGLAFVIAGLLPWHGELDRVLTMDSGIQMPVGIYQHQLKMSEVNPAKYPAPQGSIVSIDDPQRPWASMLVLLTGLAMTIAGAVNVFHGRLTMFTPVLIGMVMNFLALWFTKANWIFTKLNDAGEEVLVATATRNNPFMHMIDAFSNIVGGLFGFPGQAGHDAWLAAQRAMGPGAYLAVIADCFLLVYVVAMLFIGFKAAKSKEAEAGGSRRGGSSSSRNRKPAGPLPGSSSAPSSDDEKKDGSDDA